MTDSHPETSSFGRMAWRKSSRSLAMGFTALFLLAAVLSGIDRLAFLVVTVQPLLVLAGIGWAAHFTLRLGVYRQYRTMVSAQGPGGAIVELATLRGWRRRAGCAAASSQAENQFLAAQRHFQRGEYSAAASCCQKSIDARLTLAAALNWGVALLNTARIDAAAHVLDRALERVQEAEDPELVAALHTNLGAVKARRGDLQAALVEYDTAATLWAVLSDDRGLADTLLNRAQALSHLGHTRGEEIRRLCDRALRIYQQRGVAVGRANALTSLANAWLEDGETDEALRLLRAAITLHDHTRNLLGQANAQACLGHTHFRRAELPEARVAYEEAARLFHAVGELVGEASALANVGNIRFMNGDLEGALGAYENALSVHERSGNALGEAQTRTNIAAAQVRLRRLGAALASLLRARELYESTGVGGRGREAADTLIARLEQRREQLRRRQPDGGQIPPGETAVRSTA